MDRWTRRAGRRATATVRARADRRWLRATLTENRQRETEEYA